MEENVKTFSRLLVCAFSANFGDSCSMVKTRERIPMHLHILFAATYDPGDQLSIRIMHLGYCGLNFKLHIFAYLSNVAQNCIFEGCCIELHIWRILHKIAYFEANTDVLKVTFQRKNEKKEEIKQGDTRFKFEDNKNRSQRQECSVRLPSRRLDYKGDKHS